MNTVEIQIDRKRKNELDRASEKNRINQEITCYYWYEIHINKSIQHRSGSIRDRAWASERTEEEVRQKGPKEVGHLPKLILVRGEVRREIVYA